MLEVYLWVPARGWKLLRAFQSDEREEAKRFALSFTPLEVKLTDLGVNREWVSGRMHNPCPSDPGIWQIETMDEPKPVKV